MLLWDSESYVIIFMKLCTVISFAIVLLLRDYGPYVFYENVGDHLLLSDFGPYGITYVVYNLSW
jgi:hypothetical protein